MKNKWIELAPGVRSCYRRGALEIEIFDINDGIKQSKTEGVSLIDYTGSDERMFMREQLLKNALGLLINISFYSKETGKKMVTELAKLAITSSDWDAEVVLAKHRGEEEPLSALEVAQKLVTRDFSPQLPEVKSPH